MLHLLPRCLVGVQLGYKASLCIDGATKPCHYCRCGSCTKHIKPQLSVHYGPAHTAVQQLHSTAQLSLKALDDVGPEPEADNACNTELHCARVDANGQNGKVDVYGVVGTVCAHGVPVRFGTVDMVTPECFPYYILLLFNLLLRLPHVQYVFVDFACQLRVSWKRFLGKQCGPGGLLEEHPELAERLQRVDLLVNWMHAEGHSLQCQLTNSGRHHDGTGRRYGENTEQLWALVKVRYVSQLLLCSLHFGILAPGHL
jgi:hypothetical protein